MAVIQCKMCGGSLNVEEGKTIVQCEYCETTQTVPNVDDERKLTLFNRANRLRFGNEFDKAAGIYETIISEFQQEAEAYWGLVLCKYGIEYVDDPATGKKIPTCHRSSFDSVMDDENFELAQEYSDAVTRKVYRDEAKQIEELRKGIVEVSAKEEPYDIFICYKETAENGDRTLDSVLAQDVYDALTEKGYRVFFSRITLEDRLGREYEPYIFAALNSAKVMLAFGTDYEHFNAVWVKNEWSRYLQLMTKDKTKHLIPCFKGIDAYDMPKEFAKLQAQDMGKVGAVQDLLRGIEKLLPKEQSAETVVQQVVQTGGVNTNALLERAFLYLEDGEWANADKYCEKVLDMDPKCAEAYLGKLMADLKCRKKEDLKNQAQPFDNNGNFAKAVRFADGAMSNTLKGCIAYIKERDETARLQGIYDRGVNLKNTATTEKDFLQAADMLAQIPSFRDAGELVKQCQEAAEVARKEAILSDAKLKMYGTSILNYESAIKLLDPIRGWKDTDEQIRQCVTAIQKIQEKEKRDKRCIVGILTILCVTAVIMIMRFTIIIPHNKYNSAVKLMELGQYEEAIKAFEALEEYKDSKEQTINCKYYQAKALMDEEKYAEAITAFKALGEYKDAVDQIKKCEADYTDYEIEIIKQAKVGDYVIFGKYEQDTYLYNEKENIEWLVLDKKDGKVFLISRYALDCQQYNTSYSGWTWEECSVRTWLNRTFLSVAFSEAEKAMISTVTVSADKNPEYSTSPGNATRDKIFLLSITEANMYFNSDGARQCAATEYAVAQGGRNIDKNCSWWLRSPGSTRNNSAAFVLYDGDISNAGAGYDRYSNFAVRPAMWITLGDIEE